MRRSGFQYFIAYLQIIGIVLVVLGHSFNEYPDGEQGHTLLLYGMCYSFRMPLFIFVSGFLLSYTTIMKAHAPKWEEFAAGKIRRLLIPYITLTAVTFIPRSLFSEMAIDSVDMSVESFVRAFFYEEAMPIPFFWFLQTSFTLLTVTYLLLTLAAKAGIRQLYAYMLIAAVYLPLSCLSPKAPHFFSLHMTCLMAGYFALGAIYGRWHNEIDRATPWTSPLFTIGAAAAWLSLFFLTEHTSFMPLCSTAGIAMCVSVAKLLEKHEVGWLDHLIGANYIIFLLSWYFNVAAQQILHHFTSFPWWVYTLLSLTAGIYAPWLFYRYLCRHPGSRAAWISRKFLGQSLR